MVIIGGGDCGTLREVLRHAGVRTAVQCDIDEQVTRMAEKYFPELCESNGDPRATVMFDDGIAYMANAAPESIDVIIVDSTDPVGPAEGLFNRAFYDSCLQALRPDGILVQQSESPLALMQLILDMRATMARGRLPVLPHAAVPAALLSDRLVELHDRVEVGARPDAVPRGRRQRQDVRDAVLQRRHPRRRADAAGIHARGAGRVAAT